jgi:hypothetical protein
MLRNEDPQVVEELLGHYVYHKQRLLDAAGVRGQLDVGVVRELMRPRLEKMADAVVELDIDPGVAMEAAFALARRNRHPDGPMPNMLGSVKYLSKALSNYLEVPYEAVMERRSKHIFLAKMSESFERFAESIERSGVDLVMATSYPTDVLYLMAVKRADWESVYQLSPALLEDLAKDRRRRMWMEHMGASYEAVAKLFNNMRKKREGNTP